MEWLEESITKSTREIQSNSTAETEQILERHEKNLDQLDKKKKVFMIFIKYVPHRKKEKVYSKHIK